MNIKLNPLLKHCVTRLKIIASDPIGNELLYDATGYWVKNFENKTVLVTNKHNLDPAIVSDKYEGYKIKEIKVLIREKAIDGYSDRTEFFTMKLTTIKGLVHVTADIAILIDPTFEGNKIAGNFGFEPLNTTEIADEKFFLNSCELFDPIGFIGYPRTWFDIEANLPIGRPAYLASYPHKPFKNPLIKTEDTLLVSGLSFQASSGSPVFSFPKGLEIKGLGVIEVESPYTPPKLIGVMSGHFPDYLEKDRSEWKVHSGLSYFTRSTALLELLTNKFGAPIESFIHDVVFNPVSN